MGQHLVFKGNRLTPVSAKADEVLLFIAHKAQVTLQ
jgi:hypothetical protein